MKIEQKEERRRMEELGLVQPQLPFEENNQKPRCGDCGREMVWNNKAAKGGRFVCPNCGNK